jgi:hypothetical protein
MICIYKYNCGVATHDFEQTAGREEMWLYFNVPLHCNIKYIFRNVTYIIAKLKPDIVGGKCPRYVIL